MIEAPFLLCVRSGGQTGADWAGVDAAYCQNVPTAGTMPKGYRTLDGPRPEYAEKYNMKEHASENYPPRTYENVRDSDGTIRFAINMESSGEKCTLKAINQYGKTHFDVHIKDVTKFELPPEEHPKAAVEWMIRENVRHLNVAGNSEKSAPGIGVFVHRYVTAMIRYIRELENGGQTSTEIVREMRDE